jgi:hypothetical protein
MPNWLIYVMRGVENAKELKFNDDDFHCPTVLEIEAGDVEGKKTEMLTLSKQKKSNALTEILEEVI